MNENENIDSDSALVSVIMPVYNCEQYLTTSITSCLMQEHQNWELIMIDDCSTDKSLDVAKEFSDPRIRIHQQPLNLGPAAARNVALGMCRGEWITVLDSDDSMCTNRLSTFLKVAASNGPNFVYYENLQTWSGLGEIPIQEDRILPGTLSNNCQIIDINEWMLNEGFAKPFFHRSLTSLPAVRYPENIRGPEDTVFLVRMCVSNNVKLLKLPLSGYIYRKTPGSLSRRGEDQVRATRIACDLLREVAILQPSIATGVAKFTRKNENYYEYIKFSTIWTNHEYLKLVGLIARSPRTVIALSELVWQKFSYDFTNGLRRFRRKRFR
jgi:succinoglycan biosynthesis protein ExoO